MLENATVNYDGSMTERFLTFTVDAESNDFRTKMLENNSVSGYLPLSTHRNPENRMVYRYDITDKVSLTDYIAEHEVTASFLADLLEQLERIFLRGKGFMLEEDNYVLLLNYMYFDAEGNLAICYLPSYECGIKHQIYTLIGDLLKMVDTEDKNNVFLMYRAYAKAGEDSCTFRSIIACLLPEEPKALVPAGKSPEPAEPVGTSPKSSGKFFIGRKTKEKIEYIALVSVFTLVILFYIFH